MASTRFTAALRRWRQVSRPFVPTWKSGWRPAMEMRFRLAAITPSTCCGAMLVSRCCFSTTRSRVDQGAILADFGTQQEGEIDALWIVGPAVQSRFAGHWFRGYV